MTVWACGSSFQIPQERNSVLSSMRHNDSPRHIHIGNSQPRQRRPSNASADYGHAKIVALLQMSAARPLGRASLENADRSSSQIRGLVLSVILANMSYLTLAARRLGRKSSLRERPGGNGCCISEGFDPFRKTHTPGSRRRLALTHSVISSGNPSHSLYKVRNRDMMRIVRRRLRTPLLRRSRQVALRVHGSAEADGTVASLYAS